MKMMQTDAQRLSHEDRLRIRRIVETQVPMNDEDWKRQVSAHAKAGRDTKSALPLWRRWTNLFH